MNLKIKNVLAAFFPFILFCSFLPLFLFNLNGHSLVDFDEAWYATIASNILQSKNPINLTFNGADFYEHPPLGFNLMAASILIFGTSEFAARFPSALAAFLSLITLYLIGSKLFNKNVGIASSLILASSVWFVYRARTADLDSSLLFFYLLTFYTAIKALEHKKFLYLFAILFVITLLIKSMFALTLVPAIVILFMLNKQQFKAKDFLNPSLLFTALILLFGLLIFISYHKNLAVLSRYLLIGFKGNGTKFANILNIPNTNAYLYLHYGIERWFYLLIPATLGSVFLCRKNKNIIVIYAWFFTLFFGFLTNNKTEIWHLIPIYAPSALLIAFFCFKVKEQILKIITTTTKNKHYLQNVSNLLFVSLFLIAALYQIYKFKEGIKLFGKDKNPVAELAKQAKLTNAPLYLDTEVAVPAAAAYYSGKNVVVFRLRQNNNSLSDLLLYEPRPFYLITENWKLDLDKIPSDQYKVIAENNGHVLISPNN